jgi:hypothetical protein
MLFHGNDSLLEAKNGLLDLTLLMFQAFQYAVLSINAVVEIVKVEVFVVWVFEGHELGSSGIEVLLGLRVCVYFLFLFLLWFWQLGGLDFVFALLPDVLGKVKPDSLLF